MDEHALPADLVEFLRAGRALEYATWTDVAASPLRYVDAQWAPRPGDLYLAPWLHGYDWRPGSPWD